jgi:hypothetical protein
MIEQLRNDATLIQHILRESAKLGMYSIWSPEEIESYQAINTEKYQTIAAEIEKTQNFSENNNN